MIKPITWSTGKFPYDIVCAQDDREEWQQAHLSGVGASQIAAVLGEARFGSRLRIWAEKIGRLEPRDFSDNEAVQMGLELEPIVAKKYQERTGRLIDRAGELLRSTTYPWAICTPDYWTLDDNGEHSIPVQIKTTSAYRLNDWADGCPKEVWWQVQHEMLVTGAPWASVGVLVGGQRFMWADVERDDAAIGRIIIEGEKFWEHIQDQTYPEVDGNDIEAILDIFPESNDFVDIALPQDATTWDVELLEKKVQKGMLEQEIADIESRLKLAIGDSERGVLHDGSCAYTHKNQSRWNYKPMSTEVIPTEEGQIVMCIASKSNFRVLRRSK